MTTPENQNATSHLNLDSVEALNKLHPIDTDLKPSENTKFKKKFLDRLKKDKMGRIEGEAQGHRYNGQEESGAENAVDEEEDDEEENVESRWCH